MRERNSERISPRSAVTAAIEELEHPRSFGVVANISEGGACIRTDGLFPVGEGVTVRLSFRGEEQPISVEGFVIWTGEDAASGSYRLGLQWVQPAGSRLKRLIRDC